MDTGVVGAQKVGILRWGSFWVNQHAKPYRSSSILYLVVSWMDRITGPA